MMRRRLGRGESEVEEEKYFVQIVLFEQIFSVVSLLVSIQQLTGVFVFRHQRYFNVLGQIGNTKTQDETIPGLKNDKHLERHEEKFYDPLFTTILPSSNLQVHGCMSQSGYAFAMRQPSYWKFGSKVWLGAKVMFVKFIDILNNV